MAKLLNMDVECADFKHVCKTWPHEPATSWSEHDNVEAAFKAAGLLKFSLDMKRTFKDLVETETAVESMTSTSDQIK